MDAWLSSSISTSPAPWTTPTNHRSQSRGVELTMTVVPVGAGIRRFRTRWVWARAKTHPRIFKSRLIVVGIASWLTTLFAIILGTHIIKYKYQSHVMATNSVSVYARCTSKYHKSTWQHIHALPKEIHDTWEGGTSRMFLLHYVVAT